MMNNFQFIPKSPLLVFRGEQTIAEYREEIRIYRGNPLIEALPEILDEDEVIEQLQDYPDFDEQERELPAHLRLHIIQTVCDLFILLSHHLDLEQRFSRMIRIGYKARNPVSRDFWQNNRKKVEELRSSQKRQRRKDKRSTATGFTILGISGVGKTTTVQTILELYPQVIYHNHYKNQNLTLTQLVWLKLECPADASIKGLCLNFFQAIDDILGTNYYQFYAGNGRKTVNELMPYMALVAANVNLGVLIIDEIQSLTKLNVGGYEKILDFFVELINTIGLPVVLVGTYKAWPVLGSQFRQIRRGTGQGDFVWEPMHEDEDWDIFVQGLWTYQYIKNPCELTSQLSHALYYECQGITDFAIKVFMLAQARAISIGKEKLTVGLIKSVAKDCLRTAREVLDALKAKDLTKLQACEDVRPINIQAFIEEEQKRLSEKESNTDITSEQAENNEVSPNKILDDNQSLPLQAQPNNLSDINGLNTKKASKRQYKSRKTSEKNKLSNEISNLPIITNFVDTSQLSIYDALKQAGYISCATEYLLEI